MQDKDVSGPGDAGCGYKERSDAGCGCERAAGRRGQRDEGHGCKDAGTDVNPRGTQGAADASGTRA